MMKITSAAAIVALATASKFEDVKAQTEFQAFVKKFNKQYPMEEVFEKFAVFRTNLDTVTKHNAAKKGWTMAVNQFSDMTAEEFKATYNGYKPRKNNYLKSQNLHVVPEGQVLADSMDWTTKGAVTPVKNQAMCGSCWAFSTTGSTEGAVQIATGKLTSLSEQQLVDCAGAEGNLGCNGGLMDDGFEYIIKNKGLGSEESYSYTAKDGTCKKVSSVSTISGYKDVEKKSESAMMSALALGPVSIAIEADQSGFQHYSSGVFTGSCGVQLDHGVLAVGYGTDNGSDYWLVKNSWGSSWGDSGYIKIARAGNLCGVTSDASYPTV